MEQRPSAPLTSGQMKPLGDLLPSLASTSTPVSPSSSTGVGQSVQCMPTGRLPSATVLDELRQLAATVKAGEPLDDRSLETSLAQHFGSRLVIRRKARPVYGDDGQFDLVSDGIAVDLDFLGSDEGDFLVALEYLNRPADPVFVSGQMARLRAVLPRASESNQDIELLLDVMVDDCRGYPADVIASVARDWRLHHRFFPNPKEFRAKLDEAVALRYALLDAFRSGKTKALECRPAPMALAGDVRLSKSHKELDRSLWLTKHWLEWVNDAVGMADLADRGVAIDGEFWTQEAERRKIEAEKHLK